MRAPARRWGLAAAIAATHGARAAETESAAGTDQSEPDEAIVVEARLTGSSLQSSGLSAADVDRWGSRSAAELLERDVSRSASTGARGERILTVRGFDQRQVAVFVDGVPASVPYDGQIDLGKLPAASVESVEVTPGAAAGLLGPESLGGAIRIRSRAPPAEPTAVARVHGATHGALDASGWAGGPVGPLRLALGGGGRSSPGFPLPDSFEPVSREDGGLRDASDRDTRDLHLAADLPLGRPGLVSGRLNLLQGSFGVPTSLEDAHARYWRFTEFDDLSASVAHRSSDEARVQVADALFFGANHNVLDSYDDATRTSQESADGWHSTYDDHRLGGAVDLAARVGRPGPTLGAWALADHQVHRSQGDRGEAVEQVDTTLLSGALTAEGPERWPLRAFLGLEADAEVPGSDTDLAVAPPFLGPSAALAGGGERLELALGLARRARFPTLKERFSSAMGYRVPNLDLGPETAWHLGLDGRWRIAPDATVRISLYDAEVDGLIDDVNLGDGTSQLRNVGRARLAGADASLVAVAPRWLTTRLAAGLLSARLLDAEPPDDTIAYRPAWQASLDLEATPGRRVQLLATVRAVGPQRYQDSDTLLWGTLGTYALADAAAGFRPTPDTRLRLRVTNLADSLVQTRLGFPEPGREVWLEMDWGA